MTSTTTLAKVQVDRYHLEKSDIEPVPVRIEWTCPKCAESNLLLTDINYHGGELDFAATHAFMLLVKVGNCSVCRWRYPDDVRVHATLQTAEENEWRRYEIDELLKAIDAALLPEDIRRLGLKPCLNYYSRADDKGYGGQQATLHFAGMSGVLVNACPLAGTYASMSVNIDCADQAELEELVVDLVLAAKEMKERILAIRNTRRESLKSSPTSAIVSE